MRVLELGCGGARFLPHLGARVGVEIAGIDFSELGIERTKNTCRALGVDDSKIVLGEIFEYASQHADEFDLVFSYGLVEHFEDISEIVSAHLECARPGGRVLVVAPNLAGAQLAWATRVSPQCFTTDRTEGFVWHRAITPTEVAYTLAMLGGVEVETEHLGGPRLWAYPQAGGRTKALILSERVTRKLVNGFGEVVNRLSTRVAGALAGKVISPLFAVSATKPASRG